MSKLKNNQDAADEIGLEEKNSIIQLYRTFKSAIFDVLFVLLDKNDDQSQQSFIRLIFQSGFDYLQMMVFPFNAAVIMIWNGGTTLETVTSLFNKFNINTYLPSINFTTFLCLVYFLVLLIILVILDIIYVSYSFSKKKFRFTWPLILLAQIVPLFVTVLFLPITETLFSVVQCQASQTGNYQVMTSYPEVICWEGWHLFHAAITLLFAFIFVFISSIVALALFEPRMTTNKLTARQDSTAQIVFIVNKIVTQFVFSFTPVDNTWFYCTMLFLLSGWLFWNYNAYDPFYDKKVSKFFRIASTYYFWTNLMLMVSQILHSTGFSGGLLIWISGIPFIWIVIFFDKQSSIDKLFASNLKFRSGQQLESHIKYVLQLIQNQSKDKNSYMLLIGYIQKHKQICTEQDCPLKVINKNKKDTDKNEMQQNCDRLIKQIQRMYKVGIKKYSKCTKLRLSLAFFYLQRTKNKKKAYEQFTNAEKTQPAFEEQFIIYRFRKIIRQNLQDNKEGNADLIEIIRFDNHISLCEEAMVLSARLHKQFWFQLKEQTPDLKKLNTIGSKITQTFNVVRDNYRQIKKINSSVPQVLHNYALYLILIQQDMVQGKQILSLAKKFYQQKIEGQNNNQVQINIENIDSDIEAIITVSAHEQTRGKIIKTNLMFLDLSGYNQDELNQRNLQKILPGTIASYHSLKMNQWACEVQNTSIYFNSSHEGFIKNKSGYLVSVTYKVIYEPQENIFIVQMKQNNKNSNQCFILTDTKGKIKDFSAQGFTYFDLDVNCEDIQGINITKLGIKQPKILAKDFNAQMELQYQQDQINVKNYQVKVSPLLMQNIHLDEQIDLSEEIDSETQSLTAQYKGKRLIGYLYRINQKVISYKNKKTYHKQKQSSKIKQQDDLEDFQEQQEDILGLYNPPKTIDMILDYNTTLKNKNTIQFVNFGAQFKIKTMRLTGTQIKMVYNQNSQQQYDENNSQLSEGQYQLLRLNDESYQAKLKRAINTNLCHAEISNLRIISFVFLVLIVICSVVNMKLTVTKLQEVSLFGDLVEMQTIQSNFLCQKISDSLVHGINQTIADEIKNHQISLNTNIQVKLNLEDGKTAEKNLKDAFILMEARLMEYFMTGKKQTAQNVYFNFINNLYPVLNQRIARIQTSFLVTIFFFICTFLLGILMVCLWVYISLKIDTKRYDIIIWFLDIPIPYVAFLGNCSDRYLKTFIGVKQLMEKGLEINEKQYKFQVYSEDNNQNQEQLEQQQKARKTLISKHKKKTMLQKLNIRYCFFMWLPIIACVYAMTVLILDVQATNIYNFIVPQWSVTPLQVLWQNSIEIGYQFQTKYSMIGPTNIQQFVNQTRMNYINTAENLGLNTFLSNIYDFSDKIIAESYISAYYQSLCINSAILTSQAQCQQLNTGILQGGYYIYAKYLQQVKFAAKDELKIINEKITSVVLIKLMQIWNTQTKTQFKQATSTIQIVFYVYIFIIIVGYLIPWLLYLYRQNVSLNQTIKMLNMIPLKLLPKSRLETRQFITWIIRQSNKKQHEKQ